MDKDKQNPFANLPIVNLSQAAEEKAQYGSQSWIFHSSPILSFILLVNCFITRWIAWPAGKQPPGDIAQAFRQINAPIIPIHPVKTLSETCQTRKRKDFFEANNDIL
ncbi:MAG: hypothetical protein IT210_08595 [Armatimonadetes bacterium]|nr:hypothetical protein [Armatimonadota bacterium]